MIRVLQSNQKNSAVFLGLRPWTASPGGLHAGFTRKAGLMFR